MQNVPGNVVYPLVFTGLIGHGVDGLMLTPPLGDLPSLIDTIMAEDVPAVIVGSGRPHEDLPAVSIDDGAAALAMTRELVALGHRRIGFVMGADDGSAELNGGEEIRMSGASMVQAGGIL